MAVHYVVNRYLREHKLRYEGYDTDHPLPETYEVLRALAKSPQVVRLSRTIHSYMEFWTSIQRIIEHHDNRYEPSTVVLVLIMSCALRLHERGNPEDVPMFVSLVNGTNLFKT